MFEKIRVNVGKERDYDILVGSGIINKINDFMKPLKLGDSIFIITNTKVAALYLKKIITILKKGSYKEIRTGVISDGEKYKNFDSYKKLIGQLVEYNKKANRIFIINLGGGVIGDLGGFVAHTFKRGTKYVQVPTTLLACVDSGIGGKVGIDFNKTKNIVGGFCQPAIVIADIDFLKTLDKREIKSALAEVIKYGVIYSKNFFNFLEENMDKVFDFNREVLFKIITESYKIKADIVRKDEFDVKGIRVKLNYGHTIGHAVEAASGYTYKHGEAISAGIVCANDLAVKLGILKQETANRIERLLLKTGLPVRIKNCKLKEIMKHFWSDKKFITGKNRFVFITDIGKMVIKENIQEDLIKEIIKRRF